MASKCSFPTFNFVIPSLPAFPGFHLPSLPVFTLAFSVPCPLD
jgi:hypothetical protein